MEGCITVIPSLGSTGEPAPKACALNHYVFLFLQGLMLSERLLVMTAPY